MLLKIDRGTDQKPFDFFFLTEEDTTPAIQVSAAGFPASAGGRIRLVTVFMRARTEEGSRTGEVGERLEGGFSGGPVVSPDKTVIGIVEKSSTDANRNTYDFVPVRSFRNWLGDKFSFQSHHPRSLRFGWPRSLGRDIFTTTTRGILSVTMRIVITWPTSLLELSPGGPSKKYANKEVCDNEVMIEIKLNVSADAQGGGFRSIGVVGRTCTVDKKTT